MERSGSRHGRRGWALAVPAVLLALQACTTGQAASTDEAGLSTPGIETSASPVPTATPTATPSPTAPASPRAPGDDTGPGPAGVRITAPPPGVEPDGPVVVLVHGGGWVGGNPAIMDRWAEALAAEGAVVFNASYRLVFAGGGYPGSLDDVACAVRFARAEAPAYTASDELVVLGHSAGGHLAAVVALDPEPWGGDCAYPAAEAPDRLVGLAGVYDVRALGSVFHPFVGGSEAELEAGLTAVNPVELAPDVAPELDVVLVAGEQDAVVTPSQARALAAALPGDPTVRVIDGVGHNELLDPEVVGLDVVLRN